MALVEYANILFGITMHQTVSAEQRAPASCIREVGIRQGFTDESRIRYRLYMQMCKSRSCIDNATVFTEVRQQGNSMHFTHML